MGSTRRPSEQHCRLAPIVEEVSGYDADVIAQALLGVPRCLNAGGLYPIGNVSAAARQAAEPGLPEIPRLSCHPASLCGT
jgi:hypothetical protein